MILSSYAVVGLVSLIAIGIALLVAAVWHPPKREMQAPSAFVWHLYTWYSTRACA